MTVLAAIPQGNDKKAVLSQRWPRDARSWAVAEIWPFEIIQDGGGRYLEFIESKIAPLDPPSPKTPPYNQTWSGSDDRLRRYGHLNFFQNGGGRHLGFVRTGNSAIRSAVPENPTLEPNMKWIGSPVAEIWPFAYGGGIWNPHFGGRGGRRGSAMAPLERATVVSYGLSIVTVALSVTIRLLFAIECLRRLNEQGVGDFGPKFRGVPLVADRHVGVAKSEHPRLTNGEINFEEFQPMWSQSTNVRQTDDKRSQYRALHWSASRGKNTNNQTRKHAQTKSNKTEAWFTRSGQEILSLFYSPHGLLHGAPTIRKNLRTQYDMSKARTMLLWDQLNKGRKRYGGGIMINIFSHYKVRKFMRCRFNS